MTFVFGDWDESYRMLPRWLEFMQVFAPDSYYNIATNDVVLDNRVIRGQRKFHRVFWTYKQCADAFKYCKPIIQVDGTFLYGKYRGTLLIATTQDGNSEVLPLAFAIVEGENRSAWEWFLANLREHVTNKQSICLISDRHKGILSAVANEHLGWQPPNAYHVFCIRHIVSNFNQKFKNEKLKKELMNIAYVPGKLNCYNRLEQFRETSPAIAEWIDQISKDKWSRAYDEEGRRYGHMTTNLSECVNKILKGTRNLPITALVKSTYTRLVEYFVRRGEHARAEINSGKRYCQKLTEGLMKNQEEACSHQVRRFDFQNKRFEVEEAFNPVTQRGGQTWSVDLPEYYCQCGKFQAFHYPCSHVIAACYSVSLDFYLYVDDVYKLENIANAYSAKWWPIGNEELIAGMWQEWEMVPDETMVRGKGRPKSTRIRNEMDWRESQPRQKCGLCRSVGHNRTQCPERAGGSGLHDMDEDDLDPV